jgi:hypothetical protein
MYRYHFDLVADTIVLDPRGQLLADDLIAANVANELARKLYAARPELQGKGYFIYARDSEGLEVHRAPIELLAIRPPLSS